MSLCSTVMPCTKLVSEHDLNHELKNSAWWPFALEHACAALVDSLTRDVEHLLSLYLELLNVGEFNDLLFGADRLVVLDLLDELPPEVSARWLRVPIISWNLQYLAEHGTPEQKRRVKKIRRTAVPDGRGAPTKPRQDHAVTKIAAAVRTAEGVLKEPFQRCVGWRRGWRLQKLHRLHDPRIEKRWLRLRDHTGRRFKQKPVCRSDTVCCRAVRWTKPSQHCRNGA